MPHAVGMLPVVPLFQVTSGVMPEAARKVAASGLAMIQRAPAVPFGTHGCVAPAPPRLSMSTLKPPPSAIHLKTVRRVWQTLLLPAISWRISTYWMFEFPPAPDISSSITAMWNAARPGAGMSSRDSVASRTAIRDIRPSLEHRQNAAGPSSSSRGFLAYG